MKKVTILIAVYRAGRYVPAKITSLIQQTAFNDCMVVLLNCQNLENESALFDQFRLDYENVVEVKYDNHVKLYKSWNDGIRLTDSEYVINFNMDDCWHPEYVARCVEFLDGERDYSVVSSQVLVTDECNQIWPHWKWSDSMPGHVYPQSSAGPCPMWRRSLHDKYGYFDERCRSIGDALLWEKWYAGGEKFGLIDLPLVLYYRNKESLERRSENGVYLRELDLKEIGRI